MFFDNARCPRGNVVGGVNNGWNVANSTLAFERGMSATTGYRRFEEELRHLAAQARSNGAIDDPTIRQRLARYHSKVQILRVHGLRSLSVAVSGAMDLALDIWGGRDADRHRSGQRLVARLGP